MEYLYQVICSGKRPFAAGLVVRSGRVVETAPILWRMRGKSIAEAIYICRQSGWVIKEVNCE